MSLRTPTTAPERGVAVRVLAFPQGQAQASAQGTAELLVGRQRSRSCGSTASHSLKLTYFDARGAAETTRVLLAIAGAQYEGVLLPVLELALLHDDSHGLYLITVALGSSRFEQTSVSP